MKGDKMRWSRWFLTTILVCLTVNPGWTSDIPDEDIILIRTPNTQIQVVAVPPRLTDDGVVDTTIARGTSSGLAVVSIGEQVYVAAAVGGLKDVTAFDWSITSQPDGSALTLLDAPKVGKTFIPQVAGDYVVSLKMTHGAGDTTMAQTITAATYVGVDRCGQCHPAAKAGWEKTGHAKGLVGDISGLGSSHFRSSCLNCHATNSNTSSLDVPIPDNGSFWDVAADQGWTFPADLTTGTWEEVADGATPSGNAISSGAWSIDLKNSNWDQLSDELKAMGGVQCESCHGPGSAHAAGAFALDNKKIGSSLESGVCAKCHDNGHYHVKAHEWESSGHANTWSRPASYAGGTCTSCHLGSGFIADVDQGLNASETGNFPAHADLENGVTQTCATCHDPHNADNPHQLRFAGSVTLKATVPGQEGLVDYTADMGTAAMCAQCHNLRPGKDEAGKGIHHSHQTEMVLGIGGYHYPEESYSSGSHRHMTNVCTDCHMASPPRGSEKVLGSHSWRMHDDNDTPDDKADDHFHTNGCVNCHGPLTNFDVNGAQTELEDMMVVLADLLPKVKGNPNEVATFYNPAGGHGNGEREMTQAEVNAGWNQRFVHDDGSKGAHNFVYARKLLADALKAVRPTDAPAALAGDFSGDGKVDFTDMFMFTSQFGKSAASEGWDVRYDLSSNGVVGFTDWLIFLDSFGNTGVAGKSVLANNGRNVGGDFTLVGSNRSGIDQDHIGVTLRALNMTEMRGYGVYVSYDSQVLEFVRAVRADNGMLTAENTAALAAQEIEEGRLLIADATVGDVAVKGSGALVDLVFRRIGVVAQSSVQIDLAQMADLNFGINVPGAPVQEVVAAREYALNQNFPNPFNPATSIHYSLAAPGDVKLVVYNALGQVVRTLVDNYKLSGEYAAEWNARDEGGREVASGIYVYRLEINGFTQTQRMVLTR
jgi:hypothetical protein